MDTRFFSGFCLAAFTAVLLTGPGEKESIASTESMAFATIYPAFVPHELPVPDMTDVVIEGALQPPESHTAPSHPNEDNTTHDASSQRMLRVAGGHLDLQNFNAILQPQGFQRPRWQDMESTARLNTPEKKEKPFLVMIDPGHGGSDQGAKGQNGLLEKDLTLDIANRVQLFLTEVANIDVRLTRHHDYGLSRQARVDAIKRSNADLVISLHFNHLPQTDVNLVETYYAGPENIAQSLSVQSAAMRRELQRTSGVPSVDLSFTQGSEKLAKALQQRIFNEVNFSDQTAQNAGVKQETLFVLTRSFTPGVLLEISCLSHPDEADRLESEDYRNRLAAALVDGIRDYHDALNVDPLPINGDLGA